MQLELPNGQHNNNKLTNITKYIGSDVETVIDSQLIGDKPS